MACSICNKRSTPNFKSPNFRLFTKRKENVPCVYTFEYLESLRKSDKLTDIDKSFVVSQLNVYKTNCNLFQSYIDNAVQKLNT